MKQVKYLLVLLALISIDGMAQEINWMSLEEAMDLQTK